MNDKKHFERHYKKLVIEGILKALIFGLLIGFSAALITAFFTWLYNDKGLLLSIGIGFGALAISMPIFYFVFFQPTTKQIAERLDRMGLDERLITMMELEKDPSYIAMRQREDAKQKLNSFNRNLSIALNIPIAVLIIVGLLAICSITMITVSAVSVDPEIPWKHPGTWEYNDDVKYIRIRYEVDMSDGYAGGYIYGPNDQIVSIGQSTVTVIPVPDVGYIFASWSDGLSALERSDIILEEPETDEIVFLVKFKMMDLSPEEKGGEKDGEPDENEDEKDKEKKEPEEEEDERYKYRNQFYDEISYYRDYLQKYYDDAMKFLLEGGDIPAYLREMIETYYATIL